MIEMATNPSQQTSNPMQLLTEQKRAILELVAQGYTNKQVGQQLHLAEKTVKHYMTNILQKLQVNNRVQAALIATKKGRVKGDSSNTE